MKSGEAFAFDVGTGNETDRRPLTLMEVSRLA